MEEEGLVRKCEDLTRAGHPLPPAILREMAWETQKSRVASVIAMTGVPICYPPIGIY